VIADGHQPKLTGKVDPASGPLDVALARLDLARLAGERVVRGRVLGPEGSPVAGATVEPQMFDTEAFRGFSPGILDPLAATDLQGRFLLTSSSPIRSVHVRVEGRGLAPRIFADLRPGKASTLRLARGVELKGRLLEAEAPVEGAVIGL